MICKKCKKECLESELQKGICIECSTKDKGNIMKTVIISVFISVFLSLIIVGMINSEVSISDFKVEAFNMETEKTKYTYSNDSVSYTGKGTISCKNKKNDYIVLVEKKNKTNNEIDYIIVIVHNGSGELSTYDYYSDGVSQKPEYEFNIIGYRSFKKN